MALLLLALVTLGGCMPTLLASPALPWLDSAAGRDGGLSRLAPAGLADGGIGSLLAQPVGQAGSTLQACVTTSSGAFRLINAGATPGSTGMNRACSAAEQLKT